MSGILLKTGFLATTVIFALDPYSKFYLVIPYCQAYICFTLFFFFFNSTAVKTLKCLSDVFSREIFINGLVRSEKYECFQGCGYKLTKFSPETFFVCFFLSLYLLWQPRRVPPFNVAKTVPYKFKYF